MKRMYIAIAMSLNPCFNGILSDKEIYLLTNRLGRLYPCFNGILSDPLKKIIMAPVICLYPCFNGILSDWAIKFKSMKKTILSLSLF